MKTKKNIKAPHTSFLFGIVEYTNKCATSDFCSCLLHKVVYNACPCCHFGALPLFYTFYTPHGLELRFLLAATKKEKKNQKDTQSHLLHGPCMN